MSTMQLIQDVVQANGHIYAPLVAEGVLSFFRSHVPIYLLFVLMIADVITGLLRAARDRKLASDVSMTGMTKKAGMLIVVGVLALLQTHMPGLPVADTVAMFYVGTEALSLVENLTQLGVPIPVGITRYFGKLAVDPTKEEPK